MKFVTKSLFALIAGVVVSASALAIPSDISDAFGEVDTLLDADSIANKDEADWAENWLKDNRSEDVDLNFVKTDNGSNWKIVGGNFLTFDFGSVAPEFFMVKIGAGGLPNGTPDHYLFENNNFLSKALINLSDIFGSESIPHNFDAGRVSHWGYYGGKTEVSEPASYTLLGLGLLGLGLIRFRSGASQG